MEQVRCEAVWSRPYDFSQLAELPEVSGVYAIILEAPQGISLARIGATRNARRRPADYDPRPFELEPRLRVVFTPVSDIFRQAMGQLLRNMFTHRIEDKDWLEYRMERALLEGYLKRHGRLPPANFQRGSVREYDHLIELVETGWLMVMPLPPAELAPKVSAGLKQSRTTDSTIRPH